MKVTSLSNRTFETEVPCHCRRISKIENPHCYGHKPLAWVRICGVSPKLVTSLHAKKNSRMGRKTTQSNIMLPEDFLIYIFYFKIAEYKGKDNEQ